MRIIVSEEEEHIFAVPYELVCGLLSAFCGFAISFPLYNFITWVTQ